MIHNMMDLSTAHAPGPDPDWGGLRVVDHDSGWTVYVCGEAPPRHYIPEWFEPIQQVAYDNNCILVNFDADAETYPRSDLEKLAGKIGFQTWEW